MKFKETVDLLMISLISGVTAIIPGISGGTIFAIFKISEELTNSIKELTKFKKATFISNLKTPLIIGLGSYVSSLIYANILISYVEQVKYFISYLFIGLIIFSLPLLWSETKKNTQKSNKSNYLLLILGFSIALLMYKLGNTLESSSSVNMNTFEYLKYGLVSILAGVMTILPGISGTNIMLLFGEYNKYIYYSADFTKYLGPNLMFLFGTVIGTIISSYIISWLFRSYKTPFFATITGLTASTVIILAINPFVNFRSIIQSLIGFALGWLILSYISKEK